MERRKSLHPNQDESLDLIRHVYSDDDPEIDLDDQSEDEDSEDNIPEFSLLPYFSRGDGNFETDVKINDISNLLEHVRSISYDITPRLTLDVERLGIVPSVDDLFANLNLMLEYKSLTLLRTKRSFQKDFIYDLKQVKRFKNAIIYRDGFLYDDSNYFEVEGQFSVGTKCTMLRNSRVVLYSRDVILENDVVKKILSAGLLMLAGKLTRTELASHIKGELPSGQFEVSIDYEPNSYVIIGVKAPIFSF